MNVFHFSGRTIRKPLMLFFVVVLLYILVNIVYIFFTGTDSFQSEDEDVDIGNEFEDNSIPGRLRFGKPDLHGKVEVMVSLDVKELVKLLRNGDLEGLFDTEDSEIRNSLTSSKSSNVSYVLHDPSLCSPEEGENQLKFVALVYSSPTGAERRQLLRSTWANTQLFRNIGFRVIFLLGRQDESAVQVNIHAEFDEFRDILQGDFVDVPRNATLKAVMGLRFVSQHCTNVEYVLKTNEDTFLNIFEMLKLMDTAQTHPHSVICPLWKDNMMPILRDPKECGDWCVAESELPGRTHFPQYCAGLAYALSKDVATALYRASLTMPYFWIDDVYITGLLMPQVEKLYPNLYYVDLSSSFTLLEDKFEAEYKNSSHPKLIIAKVASSEVFEQVWATVIRKLSPAQFKLLSDSVIKQFNI